jgi:kynureninase
VLSRSEAQAADQADPLRAFRSRFHLPDDVIYLDGNSLGAPCDVVLMARADVEHEWARALVTAWERWVDVPGEVGDLLGSTLLGAGPGQVIVTDSTTVNLYKAVAAALPLRLDRERVVLEVDGFPTDRYVVEHLAADVVRVPLAAMVDAIDDRVALVVASAVDFRTAELADVDAISRAAHIAGALVLWDLSHAAGAVPLHLDEWNVDFAVGCTYKYLNAGPGAPAYIYVAHALQDKVTQPIPGWFGHADQFAMETDYRPAPGITRFLTGTPNIPGTVAIAAGVRVLADAGLDRLRTKSTALTALAIERADALGLEVATPRDPERRGAHVALRIDDAADVCARLTREHRVITDHRPPDILRLGFAPLYTRFVDVWDAFAALSTFS